MPHHRNSYQIRTWTAPPDYFFHENSHVANAFYTCFVLVITVFIFDRFNSLHNQLISIRSDKLLLSIYNSIPVLHKFSFAISRTKAHFNVHSNFPIVHSRKYHCRLSLMHWKGVILDSITPRLCNCRLLLQNVVDELLYSGMVFIAYVHFFKFSCHLWLRIFIAIA